MQVPGLERAADAVALLPEVACSRTAAGAHATRLRPERQPHVPLGVRSEGNREAQGRAGDVGGAGAADVGRELAGGIAEVGDHRRAPAVSATAGGSATARAGSPSAKSCCLIRQDVGEVGLELDGEQDRHRVARQVGDDHVLLQVVGDEALTAEQDLVRQQPSRRRVAQEEGAAKYSTLPVESGSGARR